MTHDELVSMLTDGLDDTSKAAVLAALNRDTVKSRTSTLKQESEYKAIMDKASEVDSMKELLDGMEADGKPKGFRAWYNKYKDAVFANAGMIEKFEKKYGAGSLQKYIEGNVDPNNPTPTPGLTRDDIVKTVNENNGRVATIVKGLSKITMKHLKSGRQTDLDVDALEKLMGDRPGLSLEEAYDIWDKPESERMAKDATEKEIKRRVDEEMAKARSGHQLPPNIDPQGPGTLATRTKSETEKYDRTQLMRDLSKEWAGSTQ